MLTGDLLDTVLNISVFSFLALGLWMLLRKLP